MHGGTESTSADLLQRIRAEYNEMPGLSVTGHQAQRLWGLDEPTCSRVLDELVGDGFLVRTGNHYAMRSATPRARMLKADLAHPSRRLAG